MHSGEDHSIAICASIRKTTISLSLSVSGAIINARLDHLKFIFLFFNAFTTTSLNLRVRRPRLLKNTLFLKPCRLEGGGRYTMHNLIFTSLEMIVQSICSKCVNMPFRVESKVLMFNPHL